MRSPQETETVVKQKILIEIIKARTYFHPDVSVQHLYDCFAPNEHEHVRRAMDALVRAKILKRRNDSLYLNKKKQKLVDALMKL